MTKLLNQRVNKMKYNLKLLKTTMNVISINKMFQKIKTKYKLNKTNYHKNKKNKLNNNKRYCNKTYKQWKINRKMNKCKINKN